MAEKSGGNRRCVRVWEELDVTEVRGKLLLIEDLYGSCGNCKQLGLNWLKDRKCPGCGAEFQYLVTTVKNPAEIAKILARIKKESLPLKLLEKDDFEKSSARDALGSLFQS